MVIKGIPQSVFCTSHLASGLPREPASERLLVTYCQALLEPYRRKLGSIRMTGISIDLYIQERRSMPRVPTPILPVFASFYFLLYPADDRHPLGLPGLKRGSSSSSDLPPASEQDLSLYIRSLSLVNLQDTLDYLMLDRALREATCPFYAWQILCLPPTPPTISSSILTTLPLSLSTQQVRMPRSHQTSLLGG